MREIIREREKMREREIIRERVRERETRAVLKLGC